MSTFGHKFQVDRMNLIPIVGGSVGENECYREVIRVVDDRPACIGRFADVGRQDVIYAFERFETGAEGIAVGLVFGMNEPEENGMNEHRK